MTDLERNERQDRILDEQARAAENLAALEQQARCTATHAAYAHHQIGGAR
jgi:hypothetical protein